MNHKTHHLPLSNALPAAWGSLVSSQASFLEIQAFSGVVLSAQTKRNALKHRMKPIHATLTVTRKQYHGYVIVVSPQAFADEGYWLSSSLTPVQCPNKQSCPANRPIGQCAEGTCMLCPLLLCEAEMLICHLWQATPAQHAHVACRPSPDSASHLNQNSG